jgi:hypothetical protein
MRALQSTREVKRLVEGEPTLGIVALGFDREAAGKTGTTGYCEHGLFSETWAPKLKITLATSRAVRSRMYPSPEVYSIPR